MTIVETPCTRSAAALCAFLMMEDAGIIVEIVDAEGEQKYV